MALIQCKECGHMISNKAEKCPKCGSFISQNDMIDEVGNHSNSSIAKGRMKIWAISVAFILILIGGIGVYVLSSKGNNSTTAPNTPILSVVNNPDAVEEIDTIVRITPEFTKAISKYDMLGIFNDGLAAVCKNEKWGYINVKGEEVIPVYSNACVGRFSEGLAFVLTLTYDSFNMINKDGKTVFKGKCYFDCMHYDSEEMPYFINGKLYVPIRDEKGCDFKYAVYDKHGDKIQTTSYAEGEKVYQENRNCKYSIFSEEHRVTEQGNYSTIGLKDSFGKEVLAADYDKINGLVSGTTNFSNGVVLVVLSEEIDEEEENEDKGGIVIEGTRYYYGYADMKGNDTFTAEQKERCYESKKTSIIKSERVGEDDENDNYNNTTVSSTNGSCSSKGYRFSSPQDVIGWLADKSFFNGSRRLRIRPEGVWLNNYCATGAPHVERWESWKALIQAYTATGERLSFFVDPINGTVTDETSDVFRLR